MQQMKAQQASFASMFGDEVDDDSDGDTAGGDGDECTSGDKEEEAVLFGTLLFVGRIKTEQAANFLKRQGWFNPVGWSDGTQTDRIGT